MALELQGKATYKAEKDIKAGEEVVIEAKFETEQTAVDSIIESRLARERKASEAKVKELETQLEAAKSKGGDKDEAAQLKAEIKKLQEKQAASEAEAKLTRAQRKLNALDLEDEFLPKVTAEDDEEAVEEKLKAAVKRRADLQKAWGAPAKKPAGRTGGPASEDTEPEEKELAELMKLVDASRPQLGLKARLENIPDKGERVKIMKSWKSQGLFEPKK